MFTTLPRLLLSLFYLLLVASTSFAQLPEGLNRKFLRKVSVTASEEPIVEFLQRISKEYSVEIDINSEALEEAAEDEAVTLSLSNISLWTVIKVACDTVGISCLPGKTNVHVTTFSVMNETLFERTYSFPRLAPLNVAPASFAQAIEQTTIGPWQEIDGAGGQFTALAPNAFKVSQNWLAHQDIAFIIKQLESIVTGKRSATNATAARVAKLLKSSVELEAKDYSLDEFLTAVLGPQKINYWIDRIEIGFEQKIDEIKITVTTPRQSLSQHLQTGLEAAGLKVIQEDEVLKISSKEFYDTDTMIRAYDVRKQVAQVGSADAVINVLTQQQTTGPWVDTDGEGGMAASVGPILIIQHSRAGHQAIAEILK